MVWRIEFRGTARRQLRKLDRQWQAKILDYMEDEIACLVSPRACGKALTADMRGLWRYRVGDYRVICKIEDYRLLILVVEIGDRKQVY